MFESLADLFSRAKKLCTQLGEARQRSKDTTKQNMSKV